MDDADGTIAFRLHPGNGTDKTIGWSHLRFVLCFLTLSTLTMNHLWWEPLGITHSSAACKKSRRWAYGTQRGQSKDDGWRPVLVIDDVSAERVEETAQQIRYWITRNKIAVVNIAGRCWRWCGLFLAFSASLRLTLPPRVCVRSSRDDERHGQALCRTGD